MQKIMEQREKEGNITTYPVKHISVSINRSAARVYEFVSNPENLPQWASGLSRSIKRSGDHWIAHAPMGEVKVKFAAKNEFGIVDHEVTLPSGEKVHNPLRVIANSNGSEVTFTLYHLPGRSADEYAEDASRVQHDLNHLKEILEK